MWWTNNLLFGKPESFPDSLRQTTSQIWRSKGCSLDELVGSRCQVGFSMALWIRSHNVHGLECWWEHFQKFWWQERKGVWPSRGLLFEKLEMAGQVLQPCLYHSSRANCQIVFVSLQVLSDDMMQRRMRSGLSIFRASKQVFAEIVPQPCLF